MLAYVTPDIAISITVLLFGLWRRGAVWGFPYPLGNPSLGKLLFLAVLAVVGYEWLGEIGYQYSAIAVAVVLGSTVIGGWTKTSLYR